MRVGLFLALLFVPIACSFRPAGSTEPDAGGEPPGPWLTGYAYRKPITLSSGNHAALAQFPVAILESSDADLAAHAGSGGSDLVVTDADAVTRLPRELVAFDHDSGALELWVRVPMLAGGTQQLFLYYDGPHDTTSAKDVWSAGYAAVWHLSTLDDSTVNGHTLAAVPSQTPATVPGLAGQARSFDATTRALATAATGLDFPATSFSFSLWVNLGANPSDYVEPLFHGGTSPGHPGYCALAGPEWNAKVSGMTGNYADPTFGSAATLVGGWHQIAAVIDHGAHTITPYADGTAQAGSDTTALGSLAGSDDVELGRTDNAQFVGLVDEVHIYNQIEPADWIAAEHANLANPGFVVIGAEQAH